MSSLCLTGRQEERGGGNSLVTSFFPCSLLCFNLKIAVHGQVVARLTRVQEFWSHGLLCLAVLSWHFSRVLSLSHRILETVARWEVTGPAR